MPLARRSNSNGLSHFSLVLALKCVPDKMDRNNADQFDMQFRRWITYENRRFDVTPRALGSASIAETCGGLNSKATMPSSTPIG